MKKQYLALSLLTPVLCSALTVEARTPKENKVTNREQPNVIIILADDLGYGDLECYGAKNVQTPNVNRLAGEGIRFTNAHTIAATSTPSRYSLLTGESYRPSAKADKNDSLNDEEWRDELGSCTVDIAAGVRFWKGIVSCKFPVQRKEPWRIHDNVGYCTPIAHLYYQPEGSSEWKLLRCDTEYLFNRNYPGSESAKMDEAFNYLYVIPKSW